MKIMFNSGFRTNSTQQNRNPAFGVNPCKKAFEETKRILRELSSDPANSNDIALQELIVFTSKRLATLQAKQRQPFVPKSKLKPKPKVLN